MIKLVNIETNETIIESKSTNQFSFRLNRHFYQVIKDCDNEEEVFEKKFEFLRTHRVISNGFTYRVTTYIKVTV